MWCGCPRENPENSYGTLSRRMGGRRCISGFLSLVERLTRAVVPDPEGPLTDNSIMYYKHTPDWAIWFVMVGAILLTLGVLWEISARWEKATRREVIPNSELAKSEPISTPLKPQPSSSVEDPNQAIPARKQSGVASPASKSVTDSSVVGTPTKNEPTQSKPVAISPILQGSAEQRPTQAPEPSQSTSQRHNAGSALSREPATEIDVLIMVMLMGTLGGLLRLISSFAKYVGNRQLLQSWMIYYILMPLESAALTPLVLLASAGRSIGTSTNERQLSGDESLWHLCYCRHDGTLLQAGYGYAGRGVRSHL